MSPTTPNAPVTRGRLPLSLLALALVAAPVAAGDELPKFADVAKGFEPVAVSGGASGFWSVWQDEAKAQLLAELPSDYDGKRFYLVGTVASGHPEAGVYSIWHSAVGVPATTVQWERRGDRLALVEPNIAYRTSGDDESKSALARIYTGRVLLSTKVLADGPGGGPVIDLDEVLLGNAGDFFGGFAARADRSLARITHAKAFPHNVELGFELPRSNGRLAELRFSIAMPPRDAGFQPREADRRVGIYYTEHTDRALHTGESQVVRHANRWHLEKADPSLKISPPKRPIVYHIEHTTPIRYRRWVRDGVLAWNKAFERIGIVDAIEVRQQDAGTGAYMDIDPEDTRYSFVRWTNSEMGFAIGPVHYHPDTGEIYEADIVMDEGFLSSYATTKLQSELAQAAMSALHPELASWLADNPSWDPRMVLAPPTERPAVAAMARALVDGELAGALAFEDAPATMRPGVWEPHAQAAGAGPWSCMVQPGLSTSVASVRLAMELGLFGLLDGDGDGDGDGDAGGDEAAGESLLDGLPESFVGPLLRDVVMHEVGHTMGLMHNWKGSAQYDFAAINSPEFKGVKTMQGTVMDYAPANLVVEGGELVQGDYTAIDIGPYDYWAIEWNYTDGDPAEVAARAAEPGLGFTAEDGAFSPDPQAKTWDLGRNSLDWCDATMDFVTHARGRFLDEAIEDGESWQKARRIFGMLLGSQMRAISMSTNWIGGAHVNKFRKGDAEGVDPVTPVDVAQQRRALAFVLEHAFRDEAFGLDAATLRKLGSDNWYDEGYDDDHDWPVHDQVLGMQSSALTMLINPTRLRRVQDNELRTDAGADALTVPELLAAVRGAAWASLDGGGGTFTNREPMISSLERNLQSEHVRRLVDLATGMRWPGAAGNDLRSLARQELRAIRAAVGGVDVASVDAYSAAHLADVAERVERALEASYLRED